MSSTRFSSPITKIAGGASRRPKTTLALWLLFVVACVFSGSVWATKSLEGANAEVGQTAKAKHALERAGLDPAPVETVLVRSGQASSSQAAAVALSTKLRASHDVLRVAPAQRADGGRALLVHVELRGKSADAADRADRMQRQVAAVHKAHPGVQFLQTGDGSFDSAISGIVSDDLQHAEVVSVPITLIILLLAFGAFVAASVPLLLGLTSVAAALGVGGLLSQIAPASDSTSSLIVLIGLAVGVDYSLFYIRREREERRKGLGADAALHAASAGVGRAIVVSGCTVIVAIGGLLMTGMPMFASMALGTMAVVAIAVLGSLTVLPAVLALLGDRIDKGRMPWSRRKPRERRGLWGAIASGVTGHPLVALTVAVSLLVALALPALNMHTGQTGIESMPQNLPVVKAQKAIEQTFGTSPDASTIVVRGQQLDRAHTQLVALGRRALTAAGSHGQVGVRVAPDGRTAAVEIAMPPGDNTVQDAAVTRIRDRVLSDVSAVGPGTSALMSADRDFSDRLKTVTPIVVGVVLLLAFALLLLAFRSPWLAASVVGLNMLSVATAYGVLVAVFQHSWAEGLLDFTSNGKIVDWVPLFSFVILFGLSMDYTILVLERIHEGRRAGLSARAAAADGLSATGGAVTSAAVVMVAVFAIFATLRLPDMKQLGLGLAVAVLIDATIVRALALPAVVTLLGERRWRVKPARRRTSVGPQRQAVAPVGSVR
jgi:uncharacterized membrane protein YdfJ with MMPL/SSD domain